MITSSGNIKNKVCRLEFDLTNEQLEFFSNFMRENLEGISISNISDEMMERLATAMGTYMMTLTPLIEGVCELSRDLAKKSVLIEGETNLLACKDIDKNELINFLQHKNEFSQLLDESFSGLHVMFSKEKKILLLAIRVLLPHHSKKAEKQQECLV